MIRISPSPCRALRAPRYLLMILTRARIPFFRSIAVRTPCTVMERRAQPFRSSCASVPVPMRPPLIVTAAPPGHHVAEGGEGLVHRFIDRELRRPVGNHGLHVSCAGPLERRGDAFHYAVDAEKHGLGSCLWRRDGSRFSSCSPPISFFGRTVQALGIEGRAIGVLASQQLVCILRIRPILTPSIIPMRCQK